VNDQEFEPGIRSMAAPVFDARGQAVAAINVAARRSWRTSSFKPWLFPLIRQVAMELSACLGFRGEGRSGERYRLRATQRARA